MRKIVVSEFITLDGVIENPMWSAPYWNDQVRDFKAAETTAADALLLGKVTYEGFAKAWPQSKDEGAPYFNGVKKYVVSTTLKSADWNNSEIISDNIYDTLRKLKETEGNDILIGGSGKLTNSLLKEGLIDEIRLLVYPVVLGKGQKFFEDGVEATLNLVESKQLDKGVVSFIYSTK